MSSCEERYMPVVVGGVGGGGTRVVSRILNALAVEMGPVSVPSLDNVLFTSLFTLPTVARAPKTFAELDAFFVEREGWWEIFSKATRGAALDPEELDQVEHLAAEKLIPAISRSARLPDARKSDLLGRVRDAVAYCRAPRPAAGTGVVRWGWKEPNTSVFLPQIVRRFPGMKYIHVIRHGLDMAYSQNVNQVTSWGELFGIERKSDPDANSCLEFWVRTNERTISYARDALKRNFLLVKFDDLVLEPAAGISGLCEFLGIKVDDSQMNRLSAIPSVPRSLGRYKGQELSKLNDGLIERVRDFGFEV